MLLAGVGVAIGVAALLLGAASTPAIRRAADGVFAVFFAAFTAAALLFVLLGLPIYAAYRSEGVRETLDAWGGGAPEVTLSVTPDGRFDHDVLRLRARYPVTLRIRNAEVDRAHGIEVREVRDGPPARLSTPLVYTGTILGGPTREGFAFFGPTQTVETVVLPEAGSYLLTCRVDPTMTVRVDSLDTPTGPGRLPLVGELAGNAADASRRGDVTWPSLLQVAFEAVFSIGSIGLGALLFLRRPRDLAARLLALGMVGTGAVFNVIAHGSFFVWPGPVTAVHEYLHLVGGTAYLFGMVVFPDGRVRPPWSSLRWPRRVLRGVVFALLPFVGFLMAYTFHGGNPLGYLLIFGVAIPITGLIAQGLRLRHAEDDDERQRIRMLRANLSVALGGAAAFGLLAALLEAGTASAGPLRNAVFIVFPALFAIIPVTLFLILVRFQLWGMHQALNRALVYGVLAGFTTAVYVLVVILGSRWLSPDANLELAIVATAIVAFAFEPLRERLRRLANQLVFGHRDTPYGLLAGLSQRIADTHAVGDVLPHLARVLAEGTASARADVWLDVGGRLVHAASAPADAPPTTVDAADRAVEVVHHGELLGLLSITKPAGERVTPTETRLLADLAAQVGIVLRNVRLTEELRAKHDELTHQTEELRRSRQRIVAAQDAERRRMERDVHDGAQQHLVALAVKLRLARTLLDTDARRLPPLLDELKAQAGEALDELRNLARGIYPALLADQGLGPALRAQAERLPVPVTVSADGVGRHPQEVETAVYFCCLEALQNAVKHARASSVSVTVTETDTALAFTVADDGVGFDPTAPRTGSGLQNLADRLAALWGTLEVRAVPGEGTTVQGSVPLRVREPVA